jgi:hypothetical protein
MVKLKLQKTPPMLQFIAGLIVHPNSPLFVLMCASKISHLRIPNQWFLQSIILLVMNSKCSVGVSNMRNYNKYKKLFERIQYITKTYLQTAFHKTKASPSLNDGEA